MHPAHASGTTLLDALDHRSGTAPSAAIRAGWVLFLAALTAAAAQISVPLPFTPVPFTFQPMIVLLAGLAVGPRLAAASQVLYLAIGAAGLPVFAASPLLPPGALRLLGPTGGYLLAYPLAAWVTGYLAQRGFDRRYVTSVLAMAAGLTIVYACGATWLAFLARLDAASAAIGFRAAVMTSVVPFIAADIVKLLLAAGIVPGLWKLLGRQ
jgi:biotin transport system substrate-specific component